MIFKTMGNKENPAILFFHAMGVTGESSRPVAEHLQERYFCIMPTSTVYCEGQKYISKADEVRQVEAFLQDRALKALRWWLPPPSVPTLLWHFWHRRSCLLRIFSSMAGSLPGYPCPCGGL